MIEQCGLGDKIELVVEDGRIVLTPAGKPREGWDEAFAAMAAAGDDALLNPETAVDSFDDHDLTWRSRSAATTSAWSISTLLEAPNCRSRDPASSSRPTT